MILLSMDNKIRILMGFVICEPYKTYDVLE